MSTQSRNTAAHRRKRLASATLTENEVRGIKLRLSRNESPREIAADHQVGVETIRRIARGETWYWVDTPVDLDSPPSGPPPSEAEIEASQARLMTLLGQGQGTREAAEAYLNRATAGAPPGERPVVAEPPKSGRSLSEVCEGLAPKLRRSADALRTELETLPPDEQARKITEWQRLAPGDALLEGLK